MSNNGDVKSTPLPALYVILTSPAGDIGWLVHPTLGQRFSLQAAVQRANQRYTAHGWRAHVTAYSDAVNVIADYNGRNPEHQTELEEMEFEGEPWCKVDCQELAEYLISDDPDQPLPEPLHTTRRILSKDL